MLVLRMLVLLLLMLLLMPVRFRFLDLVLPRPCFIPLSYVCSAQKQFRAARRAWDEIAAADGG